MVIDVEEEPDTKTLRELGFSEEEIADGESLYGLFVPFPLPAADDGDFIRQPHRVIIYKRPLEEDFPDPQDLREEIRKTVVHELAHHLGFDERDMERWGLE